MRRALPAVVAAAAVLGACSRPAPRVSGWVVDWRQSHLRSALVSLESGRGVLAELDFFRFHLDPDGRLVAASGRSSAHRSLEEAAERGGVARLATLVNDVAAPDGSTRLKDPDVVHRILSSPESRRRLVEEVRERLRADGYDGLDLDFENLYAADREAFSALVAELAEALHADGRRLVVTVHPRVRPEKRNGPGAQDLEAIAESADEVRVMAYHFHYDGTEPGPAAPLPWVRAIVEHALRSVPPEKLSVAVYVGGWKWQAGRATKIGYAEAIELARRLGAPIRRSPEDGVPYFRARAPGGPIVVWFEDACSLFAKARLAADRGLGGISLWHLGPEDPGLFDALAARRCPSPA